MLQLLSVSTFTTAWILATVFFYHQRSFRPSLSAVANGGLTALWVLGFALLTWNIRPLLAKQCTPADWSGDIAMSICRLYKALESFAIIGL